MFVDWQPTNIRWLLINPHGERVYFVEDTIDHVEKVGEGYDGVNHYTDWKISEDTGYIEIPAFAEPGTWTLKAQFYDKFLGFQIHCDTDTLYTIPVGEGTIFDDLNAPIYYIINFFFVEIPISINLTIFVASLLIFFIFIIFILTTKEVLKHEKTTSK